MFPKMNRLSLIAALTITTAGSLAARAAPTDAAIAVLESANPHSVDFAQRDVGSRPLTKDELDALEIGIPDSTQYANRTISSHAATNEEIRSLESGNPDAVGNGR